MAKGSAGRSAKWFLAFMLVAVIVLSATGVWNPFPNLVSWINRSQPLSEPDVVWQQRVGGTPKSVTIAGSTVVVEQRTFVESRSLATGGKLWERKADWAAVAGGETDPVVATGKLLEKGYELIDPETGAVRRRDTKASGVWTYRNALLDVRCSEPRECTLSRWDPRGTKPVWTAFLPGVGTGLFADNPEVLGTRRLTTKLVADDASGPETMPSLLGFPVDGRVHIVDTATGRVLRDVQPGRADRLVVVGGRMLRIEARAEDGSCYFTVLARDPITGQEVWRRSGINLRTANAGGCVQREDPQGGQSVLVGVGPDGRETILDGYDGRVLWSGAEGEKLLSVDDRYALVRSADRQTVIGRELGRDAPRWNRPLSPEGAATLTRSAAVLVDEKPNRVIALDPLRGSELLTLATSAKVLAVGPAGMVIGDGRDIGYVQFSTAAGVPGPGPGAPGTSPGPDAGPGDVGPTCGGPKMEQCRPADSGKDG
ncbi:hypothetical protein [Micromonospora sp. NPDC004704]